jgi:hypothetical protein
MMQTLSPFWLSWKDIQLLCWRFFHLKLASSKHKGLNIGQIWKPCIDMFCTSHFKLKFHQFPHFKWIFSQHNNCSLHQNLSNHYSYDHVWSWQVLVSRRRSF